MCWGNPAEYPTEMVRERLRTMIALLQASGQRVIVYTNKQGHSRFVREAFAVAATLSGSKSAIVAVII